MLLQGAPFASKESKVRFVAVACKWLTFSRAYILHGTEAADSASVLHARRPFPVQAVNSHIHVTQHNFHVQMRADKLLDLNGITN